MLGSMTAVVVAVASWRPLPSVQWHARACGHGMSCVSMSRALAPNPFYSRVAFSRRITPATDICTLPKEPGPCTAYFERWYLDSSDGYCKQFVFGGCQGNGNQFDTEEQCRTRCKAKLPVGTYPPKHPPPPLPQHPKPLILLSCFIYTFEIIQQYTQTFLQCILPSSFLPFLLLMKSIDDQ